MNNNDNQNWIQKQIVSKRFKIGEKLPSINFLSDMSGISNYKLSKYIYELIRIGQIKKIKNSFYVNEFNNNQINIQKQIIDNAFINIIATNLINNGYTLIDTYDKYILSKTDSLYIYCLNKISGLQRKIKVSEAHEAFNYPILVKDFIKNDFNGFKRSKYIRQSNIINTLKPVFNKLKNIGINI